MRLEAAPDELRAQENVSAAPTALGLTSGAPPGLDSTVQGETGQRKNGSEDWSLQRQEKSKFIGVDGAWISYDHHHAAR
ncbi:MAG: hypothetical protein DMG38_10500 [Acidobacteria bacterium]|nr:MAG: hypothetical protein DMG38_10500 [Acidobacteriota bacterium]